MATQLDLWKDLRYRLGDADDSQVPLVDKTRYLNQGMAAMFPKIYRIARDSSLSIVADTFEYTLPAAVAGDSRIVLIEVETEADSGRYHRSVPYELIPDHSQPILVFDHVEVPREAGSIIRITYIKPLTAFTESVNGSETYTGPAGTEELPVLYAMGVISSKPLDDRLDHNKYSTTHVLGNPAPIDLMSASQFWFSQFELMLERWSMPAPASNW